MIRKLWAHARHHGLISLVLVVGLTAVSVKAAQKVVDHQRASALRAVAQPGDIRMLSRTDCGYCTLAHAWMSKHRIPFEECMIDTDAACRAEHERLGTRLTPTVLVRGEVQRGFDARRVTATLAGKPAH
jgi:glutaredoxin